jgi:hypothetical protein
MLAVEAAGAGDAHRVVQGDGATIRAAALEMFGLVQDFF